MKKEREIGIFKEGGKKKKTDWRKAMLGSYEKCILHAPQAFRFDHTYGGDEYVHVTTKLPTKNISQYAKSY